MDSGVNGDLCLLQDEKFDFNVSLSPASLKGEDDDDDEVFVGPVSHKERCVSVSVTPQFEERCSSPRVSWSPLTGDQMEAVCQEAHRLASQMRSEKPRCEESQTTNTETLPVRDQFVQDSGAKLGLLGQTTRVLSPIKRQTFCVQDSPMKQLPPAIQRHLLKGRSSSTSSSTCPTATSRLGTSSPAARAKAQSRTSLRGRSTLGVSAVLPSKPVAPTASCSANKNKMEKSRLQPPSKFQTTGFLRQSPSIRPSNRAESSEDLLSDSTSVASDMSGDSINSSLLGKRTLAPPTKSVGVRNLSGVKAPPPQSRRVTDRKNTSSSSSSVSSFNSSLSLSPATGKVNSSLNQSLSCSTGPAPSSISRPSNQSRPRRSTVYTAAEAASSSTSRRSLSFHAKKLSEGERGRAIKSTPLKRAETTPLQSTPPKRFLQRTASLATMGSGQLQNGVKTKPKPETPVFTTPSSADGSKMLKPKRFTSTGSTDGLLQKPLAAPLTASVSSCRPLQVPSRRLSALPTPVKRRTSAIPAPSSQIQTARSPTVAAVSNISPSPSSTSKQQCCSPSLKDAHKDEPFHLPDIQPFCLEEEPPVASSPPKTPEPSQTENADPGRLRVNELAPSRNLIELETTDESTTKTQEVLLLDLSPPILQPQEKLLIDLTNTPDLVLTNIKSCTTTQLIDLSSPLIKWSPEEKNNDAPLIHLSL